MEIEGLLDYAPRFGATAKRIAATVRTKTVAGPATRASSNAATARAPQVKHAKAAQMIAEPATTRREREKGKPT